MDKGSQRMIFRLVVVALISAAIGVYILVKPLWSRTDVKVGQLYNVMIYTCAQAYDKGAGKVETEWMYDVVFIATNPRDMRRQLVRPSYTRQDASIPKGQGRWMEIDRGNIQGIYYGRYMEFRFNGTLQPASRIPECVQ